MPVLLTAHFPFSQISKCNKTRTLINQQKLEKENKLAFCQFFEFIFRKSKRL